MRLPGYLRMFRMSFLSCPACRVCWIFASMYKALCSSSKAAAGMQSGELGRTSINGGRPPKEQFHCGTQIKVCCRYVGVSLDRCAFFDPAGNGCSEAWVFNRNFDPGFGGIMASHKGQLTRPDAMADDRRNQKMAGESRGGLKFQSFLLESRAIYSRFSRRTRRSPTPQ